MLIWRRVAESCVDLHPRRVGRVSVPRQRAAPDSPDGGQFRRLAWMQIIELPRRRRTEAQPVFDLEPEGLSYEGVYDSSGRTLAADRRRPRCRPGGKQRALHRLSWAVAISRVESARA